MYSDHVVRQAYVLYGEFEKQESWNAPVKYSRVDMAKKESHESHSIVVIWYFYKIESEFSYNLLYLFF